MSLSYHRKHSIFKVIGSAIFCLGVVLVILGLADGVQAKTAVLPDADRPVYQSDGENDPVTHPPTDLACRLCHSETDAIIEFSSGDTISAHIDLAILDNSAHGNQAADPLTCNACHTPPDNYRVPHEMITAPDLRSYQQERSATCQRCHTDPHLTSHAGPEDPNPVFCTDCHGSHEVATTETWQSGAGTENCINCHNQADVAAGDAEQLTGLIQNGLFSTKIDNDYCLACHSQPNFSTQLESGETLFLTVNEDDFHASVHGLNNEWSQPLNCTDCHEAYQFPHEAILAETKREYSLARNELCMECHENNFVGPEHDIHARAMADGKQEAAVCIDCHGAHDTPVPDEPRSRISETCEQCHSTIFREYASSVHGDALLTEGNEDVPTCIECHGVHQINDPTTARFRVQSPDLCATCHANDELMTEYDISTDVFETYVADFHGTTVTLFEHQDPNVETNKAVCYDCHGVHDIKETDDPAGVKANLLETCRECHPDASANFPDSWTSHFQPSLEHNPLVFLINLFYQIVIPLTVGLFLFLVGTDIYRRVRVRFFQRSQA